MDECKQKHNEKAKNIEKALKKAKKAENSNLKKRRKNCQEEHAEHKSQK